MSRRQLATRKLLGGTLAGQSWAATPLAARRRWRRDQEEPECELEVTLIAGFTTGGIVPAIGTRIPMGAGATFGGTYGLGLSEGGTVLTYIDDTGATHLRARRVEWPSMAYLGHFNLASWASNLSSLATITTDDDGNVYAWEPPNPTTWQLHRITPAGADSVIYSDTDAGFRTGVAWNPYDDKLYGFLGVSSFTGVLERFSLGGAREALHTVTGDYVGTDYPSCTPDGGAWFGVEGPSALPYPTRYDIPTDTVLNDLLPPGMSDARDDVVPVPTSRSTVLFRQNIGAVRQNVGREVTAALVGTDVDTPPFGGAWATFGIGSARMHWSTDWSEVAFIWPTSGGFGNNLWRLRCT